ncbi:MAG: hypothetical protein COW30_02345 [Rhodospirillales bacterium CG15_BIG_FIL_POST_REV_8_21_14_020_66_15]|nr:MAG: hypothetical protein COW30_02345 [Rhodospirillales bacterium CG15_BIG_FIL_POST_REV_8_21_14_020_66_15]
MSEQNGKNGAAKSAAKPAGAKTGDKTAAKAADADPARKSVFGAITGAVGMDGSATAWKRVALVLFVVAGLAAVAAVDYASDLSKAREDMTQLRARVADERAAMKAEQDKFMKESADIAEAVAKKKEELAATEADIEKRRAEAQELETKLSGLYAETKAALDAASEAARKQADAQTALDKLNAEREKMSAKIKTGRAELAALEKDADNMMQGLKETIARLKGALDKL